MSNESQDFARAIPTKLFFVSMLTRDINLVDAILDLVDNCLDGALRVSKGSAVNYTQHFVKITLNDGFFCIEDNCGGIPREIAKNYAFKMGREPDDYRDSDDETIGMYGVGMKRAIFKMGKNAEVTTQHNNDVYCIPISSAWLEMKEWTDLPIVNLTEDKRFSESGTKIIVTDLNAGVSMSFRNDSFVNDLMKSIGEHFTIFIQRGLSIEINKQKVLPVKVEVLFDNNPKGPKPYVYIKKIDDVEVTIVVGYNKSIPYEEEDIEENERNRSSATAGWTVFCNDRAVIVGDKGRLTGWGDDIPMYHPQFSVITGIVEFRSSNAEKLPITTTKRAIDASSEIWLEIRTKMREGMRVWINHTNSWKNHSQDEQAPIWKDAQSMSLTMVVDKMVQRNDIKTLQIGSEYNPAKKGVLPEPPSKKPSSRRIIFSRPIEEIKTVSDFIFDREDEKPGMVGDKCFQLILIKANEEAQK